MWLLVVLLLFLVGCADDLGYKSPIPLLLESADSLPKYASIEDLMAASSLTLIEEDGSGIADVKPRALDSDWEIRPIWPVEEREER